MMEKPQSLLNVVLIERGCRPVRSRFLLIHFWLSIIMLAEREIRDIRHIRKETVDAYLDYRMRSHSIGRGDGGEIGREWETNEVT